MITESLCPECLRVIKAEVFEHDGKILIKKRCEDHGEFEDIYWSDASLYEKFKKFSYDGDGVENPNTKKEKGCPYDCGLCPRHKTTTILANLDLTNRCNQRCPICFANAAASGYVYEPSIKEIRRMMEILRSEQPVPCPAIQFAGGEPTVRDDFVEIVRMARELGFSQIQVATNGLELARSIDFCIKLRNAGLNTIYLQFDGLREETYKKLRGYNAFPKKLKAIENCRESGLWSVTLVPTLTKGVNDEEVGDMVRFAAENRDVIRGLNVQPISFAGRIDKEELKEMRITIPDFLSLLEEQTGGEICREDFYPVPFVIPISKFVEGWKKERQIEFSVHPHCGAGTYVFIEDEKFIPITRFIDVEGLMEFLKEITPLFQSKLGKIEVIGKIVRAIPRYIDKKYSPKDVDVGKLLVDILKKGSREATAKFHYNVLFIGAMHFQDAYNFDLQRLERCGIHYVIPDGRIIPFCSYNTLYREKIEKEFAI
ncbi:MAG: tetraether lipid synthase Tes [Candidatus Syntropharchaeia archaeon]